MVLNVEVLISSHKVHNTEAFSLLSHFLSETSVLTLIFLKDKLSFSSINMRSSQDRNILNMATMITYFIDF